MIILTQRIQSHAEIKRTTKWWSLHSLTSIFSQNQWIRDMIIVTTQSDQVKMTPGRKRINLSQGWAFDCLPTAKRSALKQFTCQQQKQTQQAPFPYNCACIYIHKHIYMYIIIIINKRSCQHESWGREWRIVAGKGWRKSKWKGKEMPIHFN